MDSLSNFIGTLGRKKGKSVNKALTDFDKFETDPNALVCGKPITIFFIHIHRDKEI